MPDFVNNGQDPFRRLVKYERPRPSLVESRSAEEDSSRQVSTAKSPRDREVDEDEGFDASFEVLDTRTIPVQVQFVMTHGKAKVEAEEVDKYQN
ncbi:hypothetical protein C4D60_Mb03t16560 [Musa balbisiana]|uniref:Uncharacterized protein n=1 Tax=Musa balbisiana TaxID=52838 RepID=A0A4V4H659_MUSBA|nr:hypothetical protein C4D60_Mb03t16560 [Musa balbisiana]